MPVETEKESLRQHALEAAKRHQASWIQLGQYLFTIQKDKLYKAWGYLAFETYCKKELGIKETTASKLMKSYNFLEKEEPSLAQPEEIIENETARTIPNYESVNLLRLAKDNQQLTTDNFATLRHQVIQEGREPKDVRAQVKKMLSEREVKDPSEVRKERRNSAIRRITSTLKSAKRELESEGLLPAFLLKQIDELAAKLFDQIEA